MIQLRDITESDLQIFFEQQLDSDANRMAAFPARDRDAFFKHWKTKVLVNPDAVNKAITFGEALVGNILSWTQDGKRLVGYWIGKEYWGKGFATKALLCFLVYVKERPLYAHVAKHNIASVRVLEKCGFTVFDHGTIFSEVHGQDIQEAVLILR